MIQPSTSNPTSYAVLFALLLASMCPTGYANQDGQCKGFDTDSLVNNGNCPDVLDIPDDKTIICGFTYSDCELTGTLRLPETLESIGEHAFAINPGLTGDLVIPDSVTHIEAFAFNGCTGLNGTLTMSANTTVSEDAFYGNNFRCVTGGTNTSLWGFHVPSDIPPYCPTTSPSTSPSTSPTASASPTVLPTGSPITKPTNSHTPSWWRPFFPRQTGFLVKHSSRQTQHPMRSRENKTQQDPPPLALWGKWWHWR